MNTTKKLVYSALVSIGISLSFAQAANACDLNSGGFLAGLVKCAVPPLAPVADAADRLNGQLGRPVDHAIARGADAFVPGAGAALEAGWAIQRSGMLDGLQPPAGGPQGRPGGWQPDNRPMPMGNFCYTPAGRFGPGPVNIVGTPCHAVTPYGPVFGSVGM